MRTQIVFTIAILLVGMTTQQCTIGCVKCNNQNQCLLCDITNGYQLTTTTCKLNSQTNCALFAQNGNCIMCASNFYMDINSQSCLAIGTASVVTNCKNYNSAQACVMCSNNFALTGGACIAVNSTIPNCNMYSVNGVCASCATGFVLSNDFIVCVALPSNSNCLAYTYIGCRQCSTGFVMNPNNYFTNFNSPSYINTFLANIVSPSNQWIGLNVCQAVTVTNCAVYSSFNTCARCNTNFFLANGLCTAFPLNTIFGCLTYSSLIACASCQSGLYLSQNTCLPNIVIPNCSSYSSSMSTTTCTMCISGFFLQGNSCTVRTASSNIANCQTASQFADICSACMDGNTLTSDNLACLPVISNCQTYSTSTWQSAALQCSLCKNGFYLSSNGNSVSCVPGSVLSCLTYQVSQNICTVCVNSYYLANGICTVHVNIPNCVTYHPTKKNACSFCATGYYSFAFTTVCVQTTVRANCATYNIDGNSCQTCIPNYYLVSGACNAIPSTFANCNVFSGTACTLCNSGYMINSLPVSGTCVLPLDYINSSVNSPCSVMTPVASTSIPIWMAAPTNNQVLLTCATCNNYMYGYNPTNAQAICVNQSQLAFYSGFVFFTQCKRYGLNYASSQTVVCMECNSGMYIIGYQALAMKSAPYQVSTNPNGIQCSSTCNFSATSSSSVIPDDFFGFVNICITANTLGADAATTTAKGMVLFIGNCQRYARFRYSCNDYTNLKAKVDNSAGSNQVSADSMMNGDYKCLIPAPSSTSASQVPTNFLSVDNSVVVAANGYPYEVVSLTVARNGEPSATFAFDFSTGYSRTVDSSSVLLNVFNFKGILETIIVENPTGTAIASALLGTNSLAFCDVVNKYLSTGKLGHAFSTTATANAAFYTSIIAPPANDMVLTCLRCQFGYQLSYTASSTVAANSAFPSCVSMQNCASSTTIYGGLTTFLNTVFSCHLCGQTSGSSTFPSIWIETDSVATTSSGTFVGWTVMGTYSSITAVVSGNGFKCAAAPSTVHIGTSATTAVVSNCAAYGYISPITTLATGSAGADAAVGGAGARTAVCLACAANTYPVYAGAGALSEMSFTAGVTTTFLLPGWVVSSCTTSLNCDSSIINIFNSCGKCDTSKENLVVPVYYAFQDYTLTNCFLSASQNCFILATGSSQTAQNICSVCKSGFVLNDDKVCELYRVPNQSITNSNFNVNLFVKNLMGTASSVPVLPSINTGTYALPTNVLRVQVRLHYLLSFGQLQYGVTSCQSGWVQFPVNLWAPRVCVWSSYIYNNTNGFPTTTQYINNCLRYNVTQVNSKHVCGGCNVGFIPTVDGTSCVLSTPLPNCVFAQSGANTALCYQCATNFYNVNGQCINTPIANCWNYVNTVWSFITPSVLQCAQCLNGFALSSDSLSCVLGRVNNCINYQQGQVTQCVKCSNGFSLMTLANNIYYCYPFPSSLNCAQLQASSSNSGTNSDTISCAVCNTNAVQVFGTRQWQSLELVNQPQTLCMQFTSIANCQIYDQDKAKITDNSFGCVLCNTGFWYLSSNQTCLVRVNNPSQCSSYSATADICLICGNGSFLSADKTNCIAFPNGIFMCNQYSSASTCTQCAPGYYLSSNSCVQSTLITNCVVYSSNYTCSACSSGLYLFNSSSCVSSSASNCLTFTSMTACASCNSLFGLQTTNGITSCVSNILPNCLNSTSVAPFTCLICATGYFPNTNGVCTVVSKAIINCQSYDTSSTCTNCAVGTVLNVARTACNSTFYTSLVDPNCQQSFLTATPNCAQCQLGSFFSNGTCVQCSNNTLASGCLSCDPLNVNSCLVCKPNFYMNAAGVCISVTPFTPGNNNTNPVTNNAVSIKKAVALTLALVTLYFEQL